jgi:hypothetical protein
MVRKLGLAAGIHDVTQEGQRLEAPGIQISMSTRRKVGVLRFWGRESSCVMILPLRVNSLNLQSIEMILHRLQNPYFLFCEHSALLTLRLQARRLPALCARKLAKPGPHSHDAAMEVQFFRIRSQDSVLGLKPLSNRLRSTTHFASEQSVWN